jgi:hypothetical protein
MVVEGERVAVGRRTRPRSYHRPQWA